MKQNRVDEEPTFIELQMTDLQYIPTDDSSPFIGQASAHEATTQYLHASIPELEIYHAGELTVLGFCGRDIADHLNFAEIYDDIFHLVQENHCRTLAIDLTGVRFIPSGLLGVLASLSRHCIDIHLFNPSPDVRAVISNTSLGETLQMHDIDI